MITCFEGPKALLPSPVDPSTFAAILTTAWLLHQTPKFKSFSTICNRNRSEANALPRKAASLSYAVPVNFDNMSRHATHSWFKTQHHTSTSRTPLGAGGLWKINNVTTAGKRIWKPIYKVIVGCSMSRPPDDHRISPLSLEPHPLPIGAAFWTIHRNSHTHACGRIKPYSVFIFAATTCCVYCTATSSAGIQME